LHQRYTVVDRLSKIIFRAPPVYVYFHSVKFPTDVQIAECFNNATDLQRFHEVCTYILVFVYAENKFSKFLLSFFLSFFLSFYLSAIQQLYITYHTQHYRGPPRHPPDSNSRNQLSYPTKGNQVGIHTLDTGS